MSCLNPCCDGMFSIAIFEPKGLTILPCLNPCCDGMFSILEIADELCRRDVLILVVMGCFLLKQTCILNLKERVLILVEMGCFLFRLWDLPICHFKRLNPCCDGMFSITGP